MKILSVFGTRPEAIKMAPVVKELLKENNFESKVCVTAQHREMLDGVLELFEINPDWDLNIMKDGQDLFDITNRVLNGVKSVIEEYKPDTILIHGDTTTAMATALAAYYKKIDVGHIEAGLRTNNIYSPWPEEINRQIIGRIARWHFAPTKIALKNLVIENILKNNIFITGNTVIDSLKWVLEKLNNNINLNNEIEKILFNILGTNIKNKKYILVTGHRRENFGEGFTNICNALKIIAEKYKNILIIYPVHLNPNVRRPVKSILGNISNIRLIEPLEYLPFVYLMNYAYIILTDSGGIQEEAPSLGKPVLVLRNTTERPEALLAGTIKLVGTNKIKIIKEVSRLIDDEGTYSKMCNLDNPYGDGNAAKKIVNILRNSKYEEGLENNRLEEKPK